MAESVVTSFGIMHDRPMVLVRTEDRDGGIDWREIWCNFPTIGAADKVHLDIIFVRCRAHGSEMGRPSTLMLRGQILLRRAPQRAHETRCARSRVTAPGRAGGPAREQHAGDS